LLLVPEGKGMFDGLTVEENLLVVRAPKEVRDRHLFTVEEIYALFPRLHDRRTHKGDALSGGERQMLSIGRALRAAPRMLLLDEPSVGLAPRLVLDLLLRIRELVDSGLSLLLVEQNVRAALKVVDYLYLLERGKVIAEGGVEQMRGDERIVEAYLGSMSA
jgi:branched-chain amino acid transport system ATP-binding protein